MVSLLLSILLLKQENKNYAEKDSLDTATQPFVIIFLPMDVQTFSSFYIKFCLSKIAFDKVLVEHLALKCSASLRFMIKLDIYFNV